MTLPSGRRRREFGSSCFGASFGDPAPEPLEVVELPLFGGEDVDDDVPEVDQDPAAVGVALGTGPYARRFAPSRRSASAIERVWIAERPVTMTNESATMVRPARSRTEMSSAFLSSAASRTSATRSSSGRVSFLRRVDDAVAFGCGQRVRRDRAARGRASRRSRRPAPRASRRRGRGTRARQAQPGRRSRGRARARRRGRRPRPTDS